MIYRVFDNAQDGTVSERSFVEILNHVREYHYIQKTSNWIRFSNELMRMDCYFLSIFRTSFLSTSGAKKT
jgi:hypothetical protein